MVFHKLTVTFVSTFICVSPLLYASSNHVSIEIKNGQRCITSNGLPDHSTGTFPNSGNPNRITSQSVKLCMTTRPLKGQSAKQVRGSIGVALNGVQMRPGTADYYDPTSKRGFSRDSRSGWNLEGLGARVLLGMDDNNAHVDNRGLYHYHGVAKALTTSLKNNLIGYAADGFPIDYEPNKYQSSHQLKQGIRPSAPGGKYDGTYNEDWHFVKGSGNLDQCNGASVDGKYRYFATDNYPFFPRCLFGEISADFINKRASKDIETKGTSSPIRKPRKQPPAAAKKACLSKKAGNSCSFISSQSNRVVKGACQRVRSGNIVCKPRH